MALIKCASSRWQGNLFEDISHLREEGHSADVRLVGGAGRSVSLAHSLVLASIRLVLEQMANVFDTYIELPAPVYEKPCFQCRLQRLSSL